MSVLLAVAGLVLVRYLVPSTLLKSRGEATNAIHQAIGIVYGVAIGFTILVVWQHLDTAQATTQREASDVEAIYRHADQLHESDGNRIQELSRSYAEVVVEEEWPLLAHGQASPQAQNTADELRDRIQKLDPQTMAEQALYARMLTNVDELEENRGLRLLHSNEGVPPFLWIVLVITGIITVAFTYLFEIESPRRHMLLVAALAVVVALSLYTVRIIEYPFAGDVQASPEAFEMVLDRI
jgi:cytochrome b subunit of formate dehydrogenase